MVKGGKTRLFIDFCNITEWNHNDIILLQLNYNIVYSLKGIQKGFDFYCFSNRDPNKRYFALVEEQEVLDFKTKFESPLPSHLKPHVILPSEPESEKLFVYLKDSQNEVKSFIAKCSKGFPDSEFLDKMIKGFQHKLFFEKSKDLWELKINYNVHHLRSLEDYVYWDIISLFISKKAAEIFTKIKKCKECEEYFIAKRNIKKQQFCSKQCNNRYNSKERTISGKAKEYRQKRRSNGLDQ
jgi:hypothetical protein